MSLPQIPGYPCEALLGSGATGEVYVARAGDRRVALKVLRRMAVNRNLLGYSLSRMRDLPQHPQVVEVVDFRLDGKPLYVVTGLHLRDGDAEDKIEDPAGFTLEDLCGEPMDPARAWAVIWQICEGMSHLHLHGVIHGSLNPGNVMVAHPDRPEVKITDFAQGWVAEIAHIDFSPSFLHAPPEQLREPQRMFEGQAQRWDVYSFAFTAYRLLCGTFPRGQRWAERLRQGGLSFHPLAYAEEISRQSEVKWPEAKDAFEARRFELLDRCLRLEPDDRPTDLREVLHLFQEIRRDEKETIAREEASFREEVLTKQVGMARRRMRRLRGMAILLAGGLLLSWVLNITSESRLASSRKQLATLRASSEKALAEARGNESQAQEDALRLKGNLAYAQGTADTFLEFLLNAKDPNSPEYQSIDGYLNSAQRHYESVLRSTQGDDSLVAERLRAQLGLARIEEQVGRPGASQALIDALLAEMENLPAGLKGSAEVEETKAAALVEKARNRIAAGAREGALEALAEAVRLYNKHVSASPKNLDLTRKFGKALFLYGQQLARDGELKTALRSLQSAMQLLETLAQSADAREEDEYNLALCQFEVGLIRVWENQGIEAFEAFQLASRGYSRLMDEKPQIPEYRFQLARCLYYLGELSFQEKGDEEDSALARHSMRELLLLLLQKDEANRDYQFYLALVLVDLAEMARDAGSPDVAEENLNQAVGILEELRKAEPEDADVAFRLALAAAVKGDLLLDAQNTEEALAHMARAESLLQGIESSGGEVSVPAHVYAFRKATLAGSHGHALEVAEKNAEAADHFQRARGLLEQLASERPQDDRIRDALEAVKTRSATDS